MYFAFLSWVDADFYVHVRPMFSLCTPRDPSKLFAKYPQEHHQTRVKDLFDNLEGIQKCRDIFRHVCCRCISTYLHTGVSIGGATGAVHKGPEAFRANEGFCLLQLSYCSLQSNSSQATLKSILTWIWLLYCIPPCVLHLWGWVCACVWGERTGPRKTLNQGQTQFC